MSKSPAGFFGETVLEIDLNALAHNYNYLLSQVPKETKFLAVIKAYAYGSHPVAVAKELEKLGVDYFAVAYVDEGVSLREAGITTPILVLHPQPVNFGTLIDRCLEPALYSARIFNSFLKVAEQKNQQDYPVHIKFNTGLNRLGFWENDTRWLLDQLSETKRIKIKSLFSHLVASEDPKEREFSLQQINSFKKISEEILQQLSYKPLLHQSNTSGIINYPEAHFDMVRTGIGLYGYGNSKKIDEKLKPIARLKTVISQIHLIEPNESVGYNRAYRASGFEKIATLPLGHADGISRKYGNGNGWVMVHGNRAPIIGNVCMDMLMINITGIECKEGDEVEILGPANPASTLAEGSSSISYELLTALSQRIKRTVHRK